MSRSLFSALLKERKLLSGPGSEKETWHLVLDIKGSGLTYKVGDSVAIFAPHDPLLVEKTLRAFGFSGNETIVCKRTQELFSLRDYLTHKVSITHLNPGLLKNLFQGTPPLNGADYELWDLAESHPEIRLPAQKLADLLSPLLPRFYSIASAQEVVGDEIHLTVVLTSYHSKGHLRLGVASHFLCHLATLQQTRLAIYLQPAKDFTLPEKTEADIIMVGPGTGIAPFRAFMQRRLAESHSGQNWLFFGEQRRAHDFLYEEFWTDLEQKGLLTLSLAFSRDQSEKVYVQHRMLEEAEALWNWLEKGAFFYVCGDASSMAKDVEKSLLSIIQLHGPETEENARKYLKNLREQKRYLRDVY